MKNTNRRNFLRSVATASAVAGVGNISFTYANHASQMECLKTNRFKISLNAYSFNEPLKSGKTDLEKVMEFCAEQGFDAIDLTGYYFPGYPAVPPDDYLYNLKRKAHQLGLGISGTGIRTEFAEPGLTRRETEVAFVKRWIEAAAKLGAPVIRVFTGKILPPGYTRLEVTRWITEDIRACVDFGMSNGVIVAVQNHNDFIQTADEAINLIHGVNSKWCGLVLDTGSFVTLEPYSEIRKASSFAVNWQIKEKLNYNGMTSLMDLDRLMYIINKSSYRGYLPIETLSAGDPFSIVPPFLKKVKESLIRVTA